MDRKREFCKLLILRAWQGRTLLESGKNIKILINLFECFVIYILYAEDCVLSMAIGIK